MKFSLYGRTFAVLAVFPDTDEGVQRANQFIELGGTTAHGTVVHSNIGVLAVHEGEVIIADCEDLGVAEPSLRLVGQCPMCHAINRHEPNCARLHGNPHWVERDTSEVRLISFVLNVNVRELARAGALGLDPDMLVNAAAEEFAAAAKMAVRGAITDSIAIAARFKVSP